jgi:hypothetical protein
VEGGKKNWIKKFWFEAFKAKCTAYIKCGFFFLLLSFSVLVLAFVSFQMLSETAALLIYSLENNQLFLTENRQKVFAENSDANCT